MTAMPDKLEPDAETEAAPSAEASETPDANDAAAAETGARTQTRARMRRASLAALIVAALCVSLLTFFDSRAEAPHEPAPTRLFEREYAADFAEPQGPIDFSKFGHTNPQHARLPCLLCHRREDNSPRPRLPGHTPCTGCHSQEFANQSSPVCAICHTNTQTGALKNFPRMRTFAVRFDHATHARGGAASRQSCATCHRPERRGVSLSIPAGFDAHSTCFRCHTPQAQAAGRDISSCGTCHRVGGYSRTPETAAAYRVNFEHSKHTAKGLSCADCHTVRAGAAQRRQVTAPVALMHHAPARARSCASCHDDRRAFGGDDFKDCTRCHKGNAWHF